MQKVQTPGDSRKSAIADVATGTSGGFGADPNSKGAVWLMNKVTTGEVRKLKDTSGRFVRVDSLMRGVPSSLLG